MAATRVQSAEGTSTLATVTASFPSTPTDGNLIVLRFAADDYNGTPNTGWTQSTGMEQQTYHGGYLWWKIASGGSNSFQYTIGSATNSSWTLEEWSGLEASPYDTSNGQSAVSSSGSYTTPSITPSAGDRLLLAALGSSNSSGDMSADLTGWTNSFTGSICSGPASASGTRDNIGGAYLAVTANGSTSYSTGASFPFTKTSHSGLIIAFKVASGGGAVNGSLSQTISAVTQSATGKVLIQGSVSQTIAAFTQTATGKVIKSGSFAQAIDPVTQSATGKLIVSGSLSGTIGDFTLSASGGAAVSGSVNATIDPVTLSASGSVLILGSFGQTIAPVVQNATGAVVIKGSFGQTIDPVTLVAAGSSTELPAIEGQLDQTIGPVTLAATGEEPRRTSATSSGGVGTTWARKTLSQIEREKKAALKRARKRIAEIIEADPPQLGELLQIVREEVRQEAVEFPSTVVNDIISRLHMQMRAALIRRIEEEDEADAEFLLLVA
mgnify:CR=1 FL=1